MDDPPSSSSERRHERRALEQIWAALVEATVDGLAVVSPEGQILAMNQRFVEVWGLPPHAVESRDDATALMAARALVADPAAFMARVEQVYAQRVEAHDQIELRDGRVLDRHGTPLRGTDGRYLGYAWQFRDITQHKTIEADLRRVSETLQASLLPPRPPQIPGIEVATRYRPAQQGVIVGGDFYDVFRLRTNHWGVVLGDVCGKGVQAARLTALARYSVRAAAGHHDTPEAVLEEVNAALLAEADLGERFASAVYAKLEQDVCGAWLTLSVAGHPLPIVVRRAGWIDTRGQAGSLLGLFDEIDVAQDRVGLGPGDAMIFVTDGVTEARDASGAEFGDEVLPELLLAHTSADAETIADAVIQRLVDFSDQPFPDDVAVLVLRVPPEAGDDPEGRLRDVIGDAGDLPGYPVGEPHDGPTWRPGPPREARLKLDRDPSSAASARRFVSGVMHSWRMPEMAGGDLELLTSELVGNAIRYGEAPFHVIIRYDGAVVRVEVGDGSQELPRRLQPPPDATGGRGVHIVETIAAGWGVVETRDGKRVWFELPAARG